MSSRTDFVELARELVETFALDLDARPGRLTAGRLIARLEAELHNAYVAGQEESLAVAERDRLVARRPAQLRMMVRLAREAHLGGLWRHAKPGNLVVEISKFDTDPDAIGWLVAHGRAPFEEDAPPGAPTREVWDVAPLGVAKPKRWENAEFVALPESVEELAREGFPPLTRHQWGEGDNPACKVCGVKAREQLASSCPFGRFT